jgi:hypothetical protein
MISEIIGLFFCLCLIFFIYWQAVNKRIAFIFTGISLGIVIIIILLKYFFTRVIL